MEKVRYLSRGIWFLFIPLSAVAQLTPKTILVYYAWPSVINHSSTINQAASVFAQYDYVVLGDGLELASHGDHENTKAIVNNPSTNNTRFFGYIDAGVVTSKGVSKQNLPMDEIKNRVRLWKETGVDGIFLDDFGYDFGVSRQRQNDAVAYAHTQGVPVIANGWDPDDVFGRSVNSSFNPSGAAAVLNADDFYFSESYLIDSAAYQDPTVWKTKADKLKTYQLTTHFQILSITTNSSDNPYNAGKFAYAWYGAFLYGHRATGWGEFEFSANSSLAPFHDRPSIPSPGTRFLTDVNTISNESFRYTNTGKIWINTNTHTYDFVLATTCQSKGTGFWTNAATWSCDRVPFPCDQVTILAGHNVTINTLVDATKVTVNGKITYTNAGQLHLYIGL